MSDTRRPFRFSEDPFGMGYGDNEAPVADEDAAAMARNYEIAKARGAGGPPMPPAERRDSPDSRFQVFPTTAILFKPREFPGKPTRGRVLRASDDGSANITGRIVFPERTTVYAVSARFHCTRKDPALDAWDNDFAEVQLLRFNGDTLTDNPAPLTIIAGSGEAPLPIGGHGWPFGKNEGITVTGTSLTETWWIWICFWVIDQIPLTNLGVPT